MSSREQNLQNRQWLFERLRAEIIGPDPTGEPVGILSSGATFMTTEEFYAPKKQKNGEEILWQDVPIKRYGAGVLFPQGITEEKEQADADSTFEPMERQADLPDSTGIEELENKAQKMGKTKIDADDTEDYEVVLTNSYRPSAMGLSFLADLQLAGPQIVVEVEAARYLKSEVMVGKDQNSSFKRTIWLRWPLRSTDGNNPSIVIESDKLKDQTRPLHVSLPGHEKQLELVVVCRGRDGKSAHRKLITVSLINRNVSSGEINEKAFFQCGFRIKAAGRSWILPYPQAAMDTLKHQDEKINRILYRDRKTFAIGHGCSADWDGRKSEMVTSVWTDCLPSFETPSVSADFKDDSDNPVRVSMRKLAGLDAQDDGWSEVETLINTYEKWVNRLGEYRTRTPEIQEDLYDTAESIVQRCRDCLHRIKAGVTFLRSDQKGAEHARVAFRLANHAMLIAQLRASRDIREPVDNNGMMGWSSECPDPDPAEPREDKGFWRPFQVAFVLMSIPGICQPEHDDRELVDLIWFPTGGGKTEAYLGLTAFTVFYNRIAGLAPGGADVLMRYTLRLLTAQQFQRAALLFCSMEHLRKSSKYTEILGEKRFALGMYVGGDSTPNTRLGALAALKKLNKNPDEQNPFVLLKCPWCNARFGPLKTPLNGMKVIGYREGAFAEGMSNSVIFRCPDSNCEFGYHPLKVRDPLPVLLVDEDIFEQPPSLVIGTVDKFAMLAWKPQVRTIFGIDEHGKHKGVPPSLIIQDELHLISGPLGSMVGAYETVFEELCSTELYRPKIVASTATISRANEQVKALYAREDVMLFPPSGLEAGDSFFAREAVNEEGEPEPGRLYVGVMAPAHGSLQTTQSRIYAALLQFVAMLEIPDGDKSVRDPWWTLLVFFNSLRELGGAATLLVSDARDYLRTIIDRHGIPYSNIRQLLTFEELTSRIRNDKIPEAIQKLEIPYDTDDRGYLKGTVEACLASNIIEVGVDIDRLSLMTIVGQPKTTSQYIQVSSRVGRSRNAPGMVVAAYSQGKPRDRSHYERFRSYHEQLYGQVEPTSVTPFSPPVIERALHALIVVMARQLLPIDRASSPRPFPFAEGSTLRERLREVVLKRVSIIDHQESENVEEMLNSRLDQWECWDPLGYGGFGAPPEDAPLMHPAGSTERPEWYGKSWATPSSMRNVDAGCEAEVTKNYN